MSISLQNLTKNDFTKVCRSCLSIIHLRPLFDNTPKCDLLRNMLMNYTRLKLHVDDILPKQICDQCSKKLIDFASFISNCNKINKAFLNLFDICSQTSQASPERNNAKDVENLEIYEDAKDPSIVTQAFKIWLNDFEQSTNNQNPLTENLNITNVSQYQTNQISVDKTIHEEVELFDEIKEEVLEDVTLEIVDEERRLDVNSNTEATEKIQFEYIDVKADKDIDIDELSIEEDANLSCEIYKNIHKNDHKESKNFNCRICDLFFESITDFLTHCMVHRDQKSTDVQQEENGNSEDEQQINVIKKYMCNVCIKVFSSRQGLSRHKKVHGKNEQECEVCFQLFPNLAKLREHALTHLPFAEKHTIAEINNILNPNYVHNKTILLPSQKKQITKDSIRSSKRKQITTNSVRLSKKKQIAANCDHLLKRKQITTDSDNLPEPTKKRASEILENALEKNKETNNSFFNTFLSYITDPQEVVRPRDKNRVDVTTV